jgi:hypothetical protein
VRKHALDIRSKRVIDFRGGQLREMSMGALKCGIVDEHVDPAEFCHRFFYERLAVFDIAHIAGHEHRATPRFLYPICAFAGIVMFLEIGNLDVRAFASEGDCHGSCNA